jgi:hypothetical protein
MDIYVKKNKVSVIKYARLVCNLVDDESVTLEHESLMKNKFKDLLNNGFSPREIKELYNIQHSNFSSFLRSIGIELKSSSSAMKNYNKNSSRKIVPFVSNYQQYEPSDEEVKRNYFNECNFKFDPYLYPNIPGYDLLIKHGMYNPISNVNGVCRDHIISKKYGWDNKIDPSIISHISNCQFLLNSDNVRKGSSCGCSIDELYRAIELSEEIKINNTFKSKPKSEEHRKKISKTNSLYMTITNEIVNVRILKTEKIPLGFRKGFIRKKQSA